MRQLRDQPTVGAAMSESSRKVDRGRGGTAAVFFLVVALELITNPVVVAADRVIALTPLATLGSADTSSSGLAIVAQLEQAIASLPATSMMGLSQVALSVKRLKRQGFAGCEGDLACVAELGVLIGAAVVVTGQVGGLGDARVIYLSAVDTSSGREIGSTTWTPGADDSAAAALIRMLFPAQYTGQLRVLSNVKDALIYVNGNRLGAASAPGYTLPVGTHALRVTHPESRDFVRFVDIRYAAVTEVTVTLQPLPVVQRDLSRRPSAAASEPAHHGFRRWWIIAAGAVGLAALAGAVAYYQADDFEPDITLP
jgi:PEGA domain